MESEEPNRNQLAAKLSTGSSSSAASSQVEGTDSPNEQLLRTSQRSGNLQSPSSNDKSSPLFIKIKPSPLQQQTMLNMDPDPFDGRLGERIDGIVSRLQGSFKAGKTHSISYRRQQLRNLERMLLENEKELTECLAKDLHKPRYEALVGEIDMVTNEVRTALANLSRWTRAKTIVRHPMTMIDATVQVSRIPYGMVLIIAPWNYPILLSLQPLVGAIAAGNVVILKPSELSRETARVLTSLLSRYLDPDCYQVINGDAQETDSLLNGPHRFDYIFFTGSTHVGRIVYKAAAPKLTPVTLELGGKCPVWLDKGLVLDRLVWRRILWGRFMNAGQTCVAPDYVMTQKLTRQDSQKLSELQRELVKEFYGEDPSESPDYGRIINPRNFTRLQKLLNNTSGRVVVGGETKADEKYIAPTIVHDVTPTDSLMQEELFGPILPIMMVDNFGEAIDYVVNGGLGKPLAAYIFTKHSDQIARWKRSVISGALTINDTILQISLCKVPFGGVGESGVGLPYHGRNTFEVFSHERPVLHRSRDVISESITGARYPPFTRFNLLLSRFASRKWPVFLPSFHLSIAKVIFFFTGFLFCFALNYVLKTFK